ncbi:helix-turn-helix transcriptional regulator [Listeria sp. FSL L7-0229]|uniref:helix-turn-helix domain-containing protein n=1 Tax=Listeria cossartiae TaxID=2838249 RepID=UPI001624C476|nr:helix-turn-helix transcriptional regulator [Listeria cossartiae]MBC2191703.1 helix-turn-helix transcriptional regulator [Listeria cossartiae subsp. cossartiae]
MDRRRVIANKLKEARLNLRLTQRDLAEKINEPQANISKWENGNATPPTNQLRALCFCLEISIDELLDNRLIHLKKSEKLVEFGRDMLELVGLNTPEEFYDSYKLINREQILIFPDAACKELLIDIERELERNCSTIDDGIFYFSDWFKFTARWLSSDENEKFKNMLNQLQHQERIKENTLDISNKDKWIKDSLFYDIIKDFITFWIWINQMIVYITNDLTASGLRLMSNPITDEEFCRNKKYFPLNPGIFLYRILITRFYTEVISTGVVGEGELERLYEYHLNDVDIEQCLIVAKEKFNYINKVKFY